MTKTDWEELARPKEYSAQDATREAKRHELEDSGVELVRQFARMKERFMRLLRERDEGW